MKIKSINTELYNGDVYNLRIKSENDTNHNYFANGINVSNCHKASSTSISNILKLCSHCKRRFGLSGTIPKPGTLDRLTVMSQMGPNIANISADFLIGEGFITPCEIFVIEMDYAKKEVKEGFSILHGRSEDDRKKLLNLEKNYAINNKERLDFITDLILKNKKNALVLFHRIEYGNALYNTLRQKSKQDIHGWDLNKINERLSTRKKGSFGFKRTESHRTNYINAQLNHINWDEIKELRIENIKHLRRGKHTSRKLTHFIYGQIFNKLELRANEFRCSNY